jgi:hypothetical protein
MHTSIYTRLCSKVAEKMPIYPRGGTNGKYARFAESVRRHHFST